MKPTKAMTIRLSAEQAELLETVATVDDQPVAAVIRAAITEHIEARRNDQKFRKTLQDRLNRTQRLLRSS
jgi:predicted transcriptional regulator